MSVVALSFLNLLRVRKQMEVAFQNNDWDAVKDIDVLLTHQLTAAFDDPNRDAEPLFKELELILALYARMVSALPLSATQSWLAPKTV